MRSATKSLPLLISVFVLPFVFATEELTDQGSLHYNLINRSAVYNPTTNSFTFNSVNQSYLEHNNTYASIGAISVTFNSPKISPLQGIISQRYNGTESPGDWDCYINTAGINIRCEVFHGDGLNTLLSIVENITDERNHTFVFTHNNTHLLMYLDGNFRTSGTKLTNISNNSRENLTIGAIGSNGNFIYSNTTIFDVKIYNTTLSNTEIANSWYLGEIARCNDLLNWYNFNTTNTTCISNSSWISADSKGLYNLTLSGLLNWSENCYNGMACWNFTGNRNNKTLRIGNRDEFPYGNISRKAFTVSGWAKRDENLSTSESYLIVNQRYNSGCANNYSVSGCGGWGIYINPATIGFAFVIENKSYVGTPRSCNLVYNYSNSVDWHHYVYTHNGTIGTNGTLYVDGVEIPLSSLTGANCNLQWNTTNTIDGYGDPDRTAILSIGDNPQHSGLGFNGSISDVRFYNSTITQEEAKSLYLGEDIQCANLVGWWAMEKSRQHCNPNACSYTGTGAWVVNNTASCVITRSFNTTSFGTSFVGNASVLFSSANLTTSGITVNACFVTFQGGRPSII